MVKDWKRSICYKGKFLKSLIVCGFIKVYSRYFVGFKGCIVFQLLMSGGYGSKVLLIMSCKVKILL